MTAGGGSAMREVFDIVDGKDEIIGAAPRERCHGDPTLVHRVAHVLLVNSAGDLLLQKRSPHKDIQPGKWDTSVGGHLNRGETYDAAAHRELREELGVDRAALSFLYAYPMRNEIESENVRTYLCRYDGPIRFDPEEISEVRFWAMEEIEGRLGDGTFTPNFEEEFGYYLEYLNRGP